MPLAGKCVVVTRAPEQARELIERLEALGATVLSLPTVSFAPPDDWRPLDSAIQALDSFDWVLLTSQNAVRYFCQRCRELQVGLPAGGTKPEFAAVGPATAQAAESEGLHISHTASRFRGEELARGMKGELDGKCVLLPRSDRARPDLPQELRKLGATVVDVVAYRTLPAGPAANEAVDEICRGKVDVITLASPSAFNHLSEELGAERMQQLAGTVALAAIGPVTAKAIRSAGLAVDIEASESSVPGLVRAIVEYFEKQGARVP